MSKGKEQVESPRAEIEDVDEDEYPCLMKFYEELKWAGEVNVTSEDIKRFQTDLWYDVINRGVSFFYTVLPEKLPEKLGEEE